MKIDIAIICPREVEFGQIRKLLNNANSLTTIGKRIAFSYGEIPGDHFVWNVAIVEPRLNTGSFAIWTNDVISDLKPEYLILAGMAGGLKDVKIGDIVIGTASCDYESGKETKDGFIPRLNNINNDCKDLLNLAIRTSRLLKDNPEKIKYYTGQIASGSKVIAEINSETYKNLKRNYSAALAVEMESNDFAITASQANVKYINIRGISDMVQDKKKWDDEGYQELASARVRRFIKPLINRLPGFGVNVIQSFSVSIVKRLYYALDWRSSKSGNILIHDKYIELIQGEEKRRIRHLRKVEHIRMPGDLFLNWVKLEYVFHKQVHTNYFSDKIIFHLGGWIGGSKKLFKALSSFQESQVQLVTDE